MIYSSLIVLFVPVIKYCKVCFQEVEGSDQCQGERNTCSGWASPGMDDDDVEWSESFRDDTDRRPGGCKYQWRLICTNEIQKTTTATTMSPGRAMRKVAAIAAAAEDMDASKSNDTAAGTTAAPSGNGGLQQQIDAINEEFKMGNKSTFMRLQQCMHTLYANLDQHWLLYGS